MELDIETAKDAAASKIEDESEISNVKVSLNPKALKFVPALSMHEGSDAPSIFHQEMVNMAKTLADHVNISRLPVPEPGVFYGDPLTYASWNAAFERLIENKGITPAERINFLKRYIGGEALATPHRRLFQ